VQIPRTHENINAPQRNSEISNRFLIWSAFLTSAALNIIWWIYPSIYSHKLGGKIPINVGVFFIYTVLVSLAIFIAFSQRFRPIYSYIPLAISIAIAASGLGREKIELFLLLLIFSLSIFVIQTVRFNTYNGFGLTIYSFMAGTVVPIAVFYFQNNYLTQKFILSLVPLILSFFFFMSPIFLPRGRIEQIASLVFGILLVLNILTLPLNFWTVIALAVIVITWGILINMNLRTRYRLTVFTVAQMITVIIIFMQQL
jgi:hypothetical protein